MKAATKTLLATALGAGALALSSVGASASIACSGDVCWHVHHRYHYPPAAAVIIHPDTWHHGPKIVIREHSGRGYWHHDHWVGW
jgi:hypothetical protein